MFTSSYFAARVLAMSHPSFTARSSVHRRQFKQSFLTPFSSLSNPGSTRGGHRCPRTLLRRSGERSIAHPRQQRTNRPDGFRGLAQLHPSEVSQPGKVDAQIKQSAGPAMSCLALWTGAECKRTMWEPCVRGGRFRGSLSGARVCHVSLVRRTTHTRQTQETR
jgi:hypothetical protein